MLFKNFGSTVFNEITLFKHKGHNGHKGKTKEIKTLFPFCVKAFSRQKRESKKNFNPNRDNP